MVVGTLRDPATPYRWAQALAKEAKGPLLTYDGDGHTAFLQSKLRGRRGEDVPCVAHRPRARDDLQGQLVGGRSSRGRPRQDLCVVRGTGRGFRGC